MNLTIGEAVARVGVPASTLRYWEAQGLLAPARVHGERRYVTADLRRAAMLRLARDLRLPLAAAVAVLDGDPGQRHGLVSAQVERLEHDLRRARGALELLRNARDCPHAHPARDCPDLTAALDRVLSGQDPHPPEPSAAPGEAVPRVG